MKVQLYIIPITAISGKLNFFTPENPNQKLSFPSISLTEHFGMEQGTHYLLEQLFAATHTEEESLSLWLNSPRFQPRIVETYDLSLLPEKKTGLAVVRAIPIPTSFVSATQRGWQEASALSHLNTMLTPDNSLFLAKATELIPQWVKHTPFAFELMDHVFSIQELRLLVGSLSNQEIDPGNFHRRLKKLDILRPLSNNPQRVHRWEFAWERHLALLSDGLIP